jgi:hypothetical protein
MALNTVSSDRLSTNVKNTNFTAAEKQDLTDDILPLAGQLGNRNLIINGAMQVAQRGTSSTSDSYQTVDRFRIATNSVDEAPTQAQVDVTSGTEPFTKGLRKAFRITNGNQTSGAGVVDTIHAIYTIEDQDLANSGWNYKSSSSYITLSFYVKSSVAQNFFFFLQSDNGSQFRYVMETGSLSADTWTKITKTIPGNTNIVLNNDNGIGMYIVWPQFDGTDRTGTRPLNAWAALDNTSRTPDQTSTWYTTDNATWEITGIQLEVGSVATDFEHRSFAQELVLCQRYCQKLGATDDQYGAMGIGAGIYNTQAFVPYRLVTRMRSTPSFTLLGSASDFTYIRDGGFYNPNSIALDTATKAMMNLVMTVSTGISHDEAIRLWNNNTTGGFLFTAEL